MSGEKRHWDPGEERKEPGHRDKRARIDPRARVDQKTKVEPFDPYQQLRCGTGHLRLAKQLAKVVHNCQHVPELQSPEFVSDVQRQVDLARGRVDMAVNIRIPRMLAATLHYLLPTNVMNPKVQEELNRCFRLSDLYEAKTRKEFLTLLSGIARVFIMIQNGLKSEFQLVMDYPTDDPDDAISGGWVRWRVPKQGKAEPLYPITNTLEGKSDPREDKRRGNIHLNLDLLAIHSDEIADDIIGQIARRIIHEASHKFAGARDWFYARAAQDGSVEERLAPWFKEALVEDGVKNPDATAIELDMRPQNADSYALFAVRMFELAVKEGLFERL